MLLSLRKLINVLLKRNIYFSGHFNEWSTSNAKVTGYDSNQILQQVKTSILKIKSGEAKFERDSMLFDEIQYSYPVLAGLFRAAAENNNQLTVLDFGGSLGSSYFQCREFLSVLSSLQWSIVEQEHFVQCGQELFETDQLQFFYTIRECLEKCLPNVVLLSSVLQYLPEPYLVLNELMDSNITYIVIDRTSFADIPEDFITIQHVPPSIYSASYPCWVFARQRFIERMNVNYEVLVEFDSVIDSPVNQGALKFKFGGMILRKL
jgi:putative methyltransferase (TIGR04325 family)